MDQENEKYFKDLFLNLKNKYLLDWNREEINKCISGDEIDREFEERQRHIILRLKGREKFFLKKIDAALSRIKDKTFGICSECSTEIRINRLKARPTAELCIGCKESEERDESQVIYYKKSRTLGKTFSESNVVQIRPKVAKSKETRLSALSLNAVE